MKYAFGYVRVSTDAQTESGLGLTDQREKIQKYYDYRLQPQGFGWGGLFRDEGVSGSVPLKERKAGKELQERLREGDQVVVAKMDRAFRRASDFFFTLEFWEAKEIGLHLLDFGVDTSTATGKLMCQIMAGFAEFERYLIKQRTRDALRQKKLRGEPINQHAGYGKKVAGKKGHRYIEDDPREQEIMRKIFEWKNENYSWREIYFHLLTNKIRTRTGTEWSLSRIRRCYLAEAARRGEKDTKFDSSKLTPPAVSSH